MEREGPDKEGCGWGGGKTDEQETGEEEDLRQDGSLFFLSVSSLSAERFRLHYTRHGDVWQHPRKPKVRAFCFKRSEVSSSQLTNELESGKKKTGALAMRRLKSRSGFCVLFCPAPVHFPHFHMSRQFAILEVELPQNRNSIVEKRLFPQLRQTNRRYAGY